MYLAFLAKHLSLLPAYGGASPVAIVDTLGSLTGLLTLKLSFIEGAIKSQRRENYMILLNNLISVL